METALVNKTCVPCQSGMPALSKEEVSTLLIELNSGWITNNTGHLYKEYKFKNFMNAMTFANQIAKVAEKEAHHPNLTITWGVCIVEIWTHKINGLTESDFVLATKIDQIRL